MNNMMPSITILLLFGSLLVGCSESSEVTEKASQELLLEAPAESRDFRLIQHKVIEGFSSPEGIASEGQSIFVSNVGKELAPTTKDGDGFISKLTKDGSIVDKRFLPIENDVLHAPKGMIVHNNLLYVADIDRVVAFDLLTRRIVHTLSFEHLGVTFLNDFAKIGSELAVVTATDVGRLYAIRLDAKSYSPLAIQLPRANGVTYDMLNRTLYAVSFGTDNKPNGTMIAVDFKTDPISGRPMPVSQGHYDGARWHNGYLYVTEWGAFEKGAGQLLRVNPRFVPPTAEVLIDSLSGPASFHIDEDNGKWWIPNMLDGTVHIYKEASQ